MFFFFFFFFGIARYKLHMGINGRGFYIVFFINKKHGGLLSAERLGVLNADAIFISVFESLATHLYTLIHLDSPGGVFIFKSATVKLFSLPL